MHCLLWVSAPLFCSSKRPGLFMLLLKRSAELVSHSGWLFFPRWSSCGVSEVSSFLSVPPPSCLPNVSSASKRKSACQVDYFHLIKPAPCPFCLSALPSQWFTHSMNRPLASFFALFVSDSLFLTTVCRQWLACPWELRRANTFVIYCLQSICLHGL